LGRYDADTICVIPARVYAEMNEAELRFIATDPASLIAESKEP